MRKDQTYSKILSIKEYSQQSRNVEKRDSSNKEEKLERETLKTLLFIQKDQTSRTAIERELIDTKTRRTFFNKDWTQENKLRIEKFNKRELKLEDESTKFLRQII